MQLLPLILKSVYLAWPRTFLKYGVCLDDGSNILGAISWFDLPYFADLIDMAVTYILFIISMFFLGMIIPVWQIWCQDHHYLKPVRQWNLYYQYCVVVWEEIIKYNSLIYFWLEYLCKTIIHVNMFMWIHYYC